MKKEVVLDVECYRNYFLVKFRGVESGISRDFEMFDDKELDRKTILQILIQYRIVNFNGNNYDLPMICYAMTGATCGELKRASDWIIAGEHTSWEFYDRYGLTRPDWVESLDLIEVAPGQASLKLYGARLHSRRLQDLPIPPDAHIAPDQRPLLRDYCGNDIDTTLDLRRHLAAQISLRETMSEQYGIDLCSKSDAQIAETVIRQEVSKLLGRRVGKPTISAGTTFHYKAPAFLKFKTEQLRQKLGEIECAHFVIADSGAPIEPPALAGAEITIGSSVYRMGIGGLHSSETSVAHFADDDTIVMDADVASYYPRIILNCGLYPKHLTQVFLEVYNHIVERRLAAKHAGDKVTADSLKITINGSFGKFGSKYSALYAPDLMIQVTVTGQLALLMLIEALEMAGIRVVSANTDGIVLKFARARLGDVRSIIAHWMSATGFEMEETFYRALISRDVNNYIAIKAGGGTKGKGEFAEVTIAKNPQNAICVDAVKAFLDVGKPVTQTILECRDVRQFLTARTVRGGAIKITKTTYDDTLKPSGKRAWLLANGWTQVVDGPLAKARFAPMAGEPGHDVESAYRMACGEDEFDYIGKVVRWYFAAGEKGALHYMTQNSKGNRSKVPSSEGAKPLMELPDEFPTDVDYDKYISEANEMLKSLGVMK